MLARAASGSRSEPLVLASDPPASRVALVMVPRGRPWGPNNAPVSVPKRGPSRGDPVQEKQNARRCPLSAPICSGLRGRTSSTQDSGPHFPESPPNGVSCQCRGSCPRPDRSPPPTLPRWQDPREINQTLHKRCDSLWLCVSEAGPQLHVNESGGCSHPAQSRR